MVESRWTLAWSKRPAEEASLFNPAFCGELIFRSVASYEKARSVPLPLALAFVILPLALHSATREILPGRSNTTLATWAAERAPLIADLPNRVLALRPVTREGIIFVVQHSALSIDPLGLRRGQHPLKLSAKRPESTPDAEATRRAAALVGRWFANQIGTASILQTLGVQP